MHLGKRDTQRSLCAAAEMKRKSYIHFAGRGIRNGGGGGGTEAFPNGCMIVHNTIVSGQAIMNAENS